MTTQSGLLKMCSLLGTYRSMLKARPACVLYVQNVGLKQSLEEKVGLPRKPSRPLSPYFRYLIDVRPTVVKNNPYAKTTDIARIIGGQWEKVNATTKQTLEAAFKKEMEAYTLALEKYKSKLSEEDKEKLVQARRDIAVKKEKNQLKSKARELGKPKKPASAYLLYSCEMIATRGNIDIQEFRKKTAAKWNSMSDKEKEPYLKRSVTAFETYKKDMSKWEEKMIRQGHIDLIRSETLTMEHPVKKQ